MKPKCVAKMCGQNVGPKCLKSKCLEIYALCSHRVLCIDRFCWFFEPHLQKPVMLLQMLVILLMTVLRMPPTVSVMLSCNWPIWTRTSSYAVWMLVIISWPISMPELIWASKLLAWFWRPWKSSVWSAGLAERLVRRALNMAWFNSGCAPKEMKQKHFQFFHNKILLFSPQFHSIILNNENRTS